MTTESNSSTEALPVGPLQEGIWLFWKLNPTSPAHNMPEVFHFEGNFDVFAAQHAFNELVRRHEALRTTFRETDSGVVQVIDHESETASINTVDLRDLSPQLGKARLDSAIDAEANRPFDLSSERQIRLTVIQVSDTRTALVLVAHHIACDGLSMSILLHEFGELYRSARDGTAEQLGPAPRGYSAFTLRQLAALGDGSFEEEAAYWKQRLAGAVGAGLPGFDESAKRVRGALATYSVSRTLSDSLAQLVTTSARRLRSTPFAILLSAMDVMIAVAQHEGDVVVATATSGRTPEFARTVGALSNIVVVRSTITLAKPFGATVRDVSLDLMEAIDHQDLPFSRVVLELRGEGREPAADLMRTAFSAGGVGGLNLGDGKLSDVVARTGEGPFELTVNCHIEASIVALDWEFALRSFSEAAGHAYCIAYEELLMALLRQPDAEMGSLRLAAILSNVDLSPPADSKSLDAVDAPESEQHVDVKLTPVEEMVAAIWTEVTGVTVCSPDDDFFEIGGHHSLLAIEAVALVRRRITPSVSTRLLFDNPRLRDFSSRLDVSPRDA